VATIRQRNGKYQVQVRRKGQPSITKSFQHKKDALAWARQTEVLADREELDEPLKELEQITLGDLVKRYLGAVTPKKRGAGTEAIVLKAFLRHPICNKRLSTLKPSDFAMYRDERLRKIQPSTLKRQVNPIHHMFEVAKDEWGIPIRENPLDKVHIPCVDNRRQRRLKDGELERILYEASKRENPYVVPIILFAIETSLRRGEMLSLTWGDIDWERRLVFLAESKNGHSRTIPLTPKALEVLASVRRQACSSGYENTEPLCEVTQVCEATDEAPNWGGPEGTQKGIGLATD
jgi:integrase